MRVQKDLAKLASLLVALFLLGLGNSCFGQFKDLIKYLPNDMNSVFLINAEKVFQSKLAEEKNFLQRYIELRDLMPLAMPPDAKRFILASDINVAQFAPRSEVVIVELLAPRTIETVAKLTGGTIDEVGGKRCCIVNEMYVVQFSDTVYGAMWPTSRPEVAKWIRDINAGATGRLFPYVEKAFGYADNVGTEVILAIDLADVASPDTIRSALKMSRAMRGRDYDEAAFVKVLSGIQGITLGIRVTDKMTSRLKVDFAGDASALDQHARNLLVEVLGNSGAMLDEFRSWKPEIKGNELLLTGDLTEPGIRKLLSLISLDASMLAGESEPKVAINPKTEPEETKKRIAANNARYVETIQQLVEDLKGGEKADSLEKYVMWIQNYARRIDRMPTFQIDPLLVKSGKQIADELDQIVKAVMEADARTRSRQQTFVPDAQVQTRLRLDSRITTPYGRFYRYYPEFTTRLNLKSTAEDYQKIYDEELARSKAESQSIASQIDSELESMRQRLQELKP